MERKAERKAEKAERKAEKKAGDPPLEPDWAAPLWPGGVVEPEPEPEPEHGGGAEGPPLLELGRLVHSDGQAIRAVVFVGPGDALAPEQRVLTAGDDGCVLVWGRPRKRGPKHVGRAFQVGPACTKFSNLDTFGRIVHLCIDRRRAGIWTYSRASSAHRCSPFCSRACPRCRARLVPSRSRGCRSARRGPGSAPTGARSPRLRPLPMAYPARPIRASFRLLLRDRGHLSRRFPIGTAGGPVQLRAGEHSGRDFRRQLGGRRRRGRLALRLAAGGAEPRRCPLPIQTGNIHWVAAGRLQPLRAQASGTRISCGHRRTPRRARRASCRRGSHLPLRSGLAAPRTGSAGRPVPRPRRPLSPPISSARRRPRPARAPWSCSPRSSGCCRTTGGGPAPPPCDPAPGLRRGVCARRRARVYKLLHPSDDQVELAPVAELVPLADPDQLYAVCFEPSGAAIAGRWDCVPARALPSCGSERAWAPPAWLARSTAGPRTQRSGRAGWPPSCRWARTQ